MHPENEEAFEVTRIQCHACRAVYDDRQKLESPESSQFMYFIPHLIGGADG